MMIGEIESTLILSICVKNFHCPREHVYDADPLGSPLGSPAVQFIARQATITDTLRSKQSTKTYLQSRKPHILYLFGPRGLRRQIVVSSARITLNSDFLQRQTHRVLYDMKFSQQHETSFPRR